MNLKNGNSLLRGKGCFTVQWDFIINPAKKECKIWHKFVEHNVDDSKVLANENE